VPHPDDYPERRGHLADLTDDELIGRFWEMAERVVDPLIDLARTHTSPSIERSVLLRMGFSSIEAKAIVDQCAARGLLGHGAGHAVLAAARVAAERWAESGGAVAAEAPQLADTYLDAGRALARGEGWEEVEAWFRR
jgi:D-ornithine 4,5-aminomutase subunit alpha